MMPQEVDDMFSFRFEKTAEEIKEAAETKVARLDAKIKERQQRIAEVRKDHDIDDKALIELLTQARKNSQARTYSYTSNAPVGANRMEERTIGAGVVNHLLTESDHIEADKANVKRLLLIVRNIRPLPRVASNGTKYEENSFGLSYDELEFLGF